MTQTDQPTTGKAFAAAAAKKMLESRIALVTTLGDAIDAYRRAGDAVMTAKAAQDTAAEAARSARTDALTGGWTAGELRDAGLLVPTGPRRRKVVADASTPSSTDG